MLQDPLQMIFRPAIFAAALIGGVACTEIPVLDGTRNATALAAPFPALIPRAAVLEGAPGAPQITPASSAALSSRLAALRNRATLMNTPVVDAGTRARMQAALARAALR